jgi:N-acetyl-gamma-glutamyl-phosphate reductase
MLEVALFGAAGYAGLELAKLLATHPGVRLAVAASDSHTGRRVDEMTSRDHGGLAFIGNEAAIAAATECRAVLLAVPPDPAKALTAALRARNAEQRIVDLSHAHRADAAATYGLTSLFANEVAGATLVANPGCYATAIITAAAPLVQHGLVDGELVVCAGSGVTGAGRTAQEAMSLGELYGDVRAYKVLRHQHVPEIEAALGRLVAVGETSSRAAPRVILTTHLLPIARGIFATLTVRLARAITQDELLALFRTRYAGDSTVSILASAEDVTLRRVVGTNHVVLGVAASGTHVIVTAAIDNLLKGAAGQALENMNLMLGLPRLAGLEHLARHA